jgi:cytochrome c1
MTRKEWFAAMLAKAPTRSAESDERVAGMVARMARENEARQSSAQTTSTRS